MISNKMKQNDCSERIERLYKSVNQVFRALTGRHSTIIRLVELFYRTVWLVCRKANEFGDQNDISKAKYFI